MADTHLLVGFDAGHESHQFGLRVVPPHIATHHDHVSLIESMDEGRQRHTAGLWEE